MWHKLMPGLKKAQSWHHHDTLMVHHLTWAFKFLHAFFASPSSAPVAVPHRSDLESFHPRANSPSHSLIPAKAPASPFREKNRCHRPLLSEFLTPLPLQTYLDFHALLFSFSDQAGGDITLCKGNVEGLRGEIMKLVWVYWLWDIFGISKKKEERKCWVGH